MKKIISFTVACIVLNILFTGCRSNMFIKRHYNDGYYVGRHGHKGNPGLNSPAPDISGKPKRAAYSVTSRSSYNEAGNSVREVAPVGGTIASASNKPVANAPASSNKQTTRPFSKSNAYSLKIPDARKIILKPFKPIDDSGRDGLSLFWIVILVILILWAIGFIAGGFGLGNLIHILLVIALVLLILWLLRII